MSGVAVVTVVHGRHEHLRAQQATLARGEVVPDLYVVVAMGDPAIEGVLAGGGVRPQCVPLAADPRRLPLAAARNTGFETARAAGCDVVIGLDVDCLAGPGLVGGYARVVREDPERVWSGPVTYLPPAGPGGYPLDRLGELDAPHPARPAPAPGEVATGGDPDLFWSLSFAMSAQSWERTGGFDEAYVGYGAEDTDFGRRVVRAGLDLAWVGAARAYHQHHPVSSPPVEHLDDILRNGRLYRTRWGSWPMRGWLEEFERRGLVARRGEDYVRLA
ncbi:glycosyltransferase family 2 protein [Nocardioides sp. dk4132]|uniref:glycosyltransferase family 2 protein n=1 Tax=unclassified Nocardioides TaxID=2615069 RepID=UPI0012973A3E|nr:MULTISPECIES: galactosyltransferase-related protein [unclassified Nocardioides]MQW75317.1 glycosyltransferase family 2 protein [Nocardioides sp. dk4132]QGA07534.1 glycosyltransferase family 2 protein [Nocardioides sp. dk884]